MKCPNCGSYHMKEYDAIYFRCSECGAMIKCTPIEEPIKKAVSDSVENPNKVLTFDKNGDVLFVMSYPTMKKACGAYSYVCTKLAKLKEEDDKYKPTIRKISLVTVCSETII